MKSKFLTAACCAAALLTMPVIGVQAEDDTKDIGGVLKKLNRCRFTLSMQ